MADRERALILVDHGSRRAEAHEHLENIARAIQSEAPSFLVLAAHLELAPPSIEEAVAACAQRGVRDVWVVPMFLVPGVHLTRDIPARLEAAAFRHPEIAVHLAPAIGMSAALPHLVLSTVPS